MFCDSTKAWNVPTAIYAELTSSGNYMQLQYLCKWPPHLLLILIWDDGQLRVQAQMNRKCVNAAQRLRCKTEDENVTEAGMIHVIYLTWLTVITAALTFLLCAQNWDPPSNQRLMSTLAALTLSPDPTTRSDIWCENKTKRLSQKRMTEKTFLNENIMSWEKVQKHCRHHFNKSSENIFKLKDLSVKLKLMLLEETQIFGLCFVFHEFLKCILNNKKTFRFNFRKPSCDDRQITTNKHYI